jgi:hypothetical protein
MDNAIRTFDFATGESSNQVEDNKERKRKCFSLSPSLPESDFPTNIRHLHNDLICGLARVIGSIGIPLASKPVAELKMS